MINCEEVIDVLDRVNMCPVVGQITLSELMSRLLLLHIVVGEEELIVWLPRLLDNLIVVELLEQLVKLRVACGNTNIILIARSSSFLELADCEIGAICALGTRFVIRSLEPSILTINGEESLITGPRDSHVIEGHNWQ